MKKKEQNDAFEETKPDTSILYIGNENSNEYVYEDRTYPGGKGWKPGPAKYGFEIVEDVKIPMDDGIVLNASVAYPTDLKTGKRIEGKFPVVIEHMPYEWIYFFVCSCKRNRKISRGSTIFISKRRAGW